MAILEQYARKEKPTSAKFNAMVAQVNANTQAIDEFMDAIEELPDGQAVSGVVAQHTTKITELTQKMGNLESLSVVDGVLCQTYEV